MITSLKQKQEVKDGFRVAWFIPIEMLLSGTMLGLAPKIGLGSSLALVGIPSLIVLIAVARLQNRLSAPYIARDQQKIATLSAKDTLAYWNSDVYDFTKGAWYEELVLKEMVQAINPLNKLGKLVASSRSAFGSLVRFTSTQLSKAALSRSTISSSGNRSSSNHRNGVAKSMASVL